jgi:PAT family beta-lactamase induction signal transducer AmpG
MEHIEVMPPAVERPSVPAPPTWIFSLLVLPSAIVANGFTSTVVGSMLRGEGMPVSEIADVIAWLQIPASLYFLWSPLVDFWIRRRTWIALSSVGAGVLLCLALQPKRLGAPLPVALLVLALVVVLMGSAAMGGLMAEVVPPELKVRASGFYQLGNIGFAALAGGGVLWLSQRMERREFGVACGLMVALPGLVALWVGEPQVAGRGEPLRAVMAGMWGEFRQTFLKWQAVPVLLMLCAPYGSGVAQSLLSGMAPDYGVSVDQVAWMNGAVGGLLMGAGALLIGFVKLPADLRPSYSILGLVNALTLGILLLGHPRPATYFLGVTLFMLTIGACYALVTALALQLLGISGKSGGSRYAIALSIANLPVWYMTKLDGWGAGRFGVKGVPATDMTVSGAAAVVALAWLWWERWRGVKVELGLPAEE